MNIFLALITTLVLAGCGSKVERSEKKLERSQHRSFAWRYGRLLSSPAQRTLTDGAAHNTQHARTAAVSLAKQTKEVENELALYKHVGLSPRAQRRYKAMLNATKRRVASGALTPEHHVRASR